MHLLICLVIVNTPPSTTTPRVEITVQVPHSSNEEEKNTNISSRLNTIKMNMKRSLPNSIPKEIIQKAGLVNWFVAYRMARNIWTKRNTLRLMQPRSCGILCTYWVQRKMLMELNPFKEIRVLVKICTNTECSTMHQVFPYELGLYYYVNKLSLNGQGY